MNLNRFTQIMNRILSNNNRYSIHSIEIKQFNSMYFAKKIA
jgi:hypothetical protein